MYVCNRDLLTEYDQVENMKYCTTPETVVLTFSFEKKYLKI